ncbi:MAG: ribonuclease HII [Candidatus Moranbacteria bacterium CG10_big_fil_rev_8_21_14_0_10_35_21]|nr:MAG: ribonuclease HII [Candidatus Moranbacteria bacterium CG10_big_fil_rev_8_21_14_0_10_35_21]PJA88727.1 MAG: ribonuclease HII [Candidatus Moranbacteria bacterium CG_4_9_14_3_um_filter_36_9]
MKNSDFELEKKMLEKGFDFVLGIDEAGRGPLAGPVVAAAATVRNSQFLISNFQSQPKADPPLAENFNDKRWDLVRDSKKLSAKQREKVFDFILENFHVGVGICDHMTIDRVNILEASFLAMKAAVTQLTRNAQLTTRNSKFIILVDGNKKIPNFSGEQLAVVGGDKIVKSISAASIIAKVTRDRIMLEMHDKYPQYGFDKHKGYGTKLHMEKIIEYGPCEIHRQSFEPMASLAKKKK